MLHSQDGGLKFIIYLAPYSVPDPQIILTDLAPGDRKFLITERDPEPEGRVRNTAFQTAVTVLPEKDV
jgi:hypothetical protein